MENYVLPNPEMKWICDMGVFVLTKDYVTPEITVPAGQTTDGASRPEWTGVLIERYDRHLPACIVHDYMYRNAIGTKDQADELFELNLKRCANTFGFNDTLIKPMVLAVKLFGVGAYE